MAVQGGPAGPEWRRGWSKVVKRMDLVVESVVLVVQGGGEFGPGGP